MSDEFASLPDDKEFASLPDDNKIANPENILQRVAKVAMAAGNPNTMGMEINPKFPFIPYMPGSVGAGPMGPVGGAANEIADQFRDYSQQKLGLQNTNPIINAVLGMAVDPRTWGNAMLMGDNALQGAGKLAGSVKDVMNPSKTSTEMSRGIEGAMSRARGTYGQGLKDITQKYGPQLAEGMVDPYAPKTVSFAQELSSPKTLAEQKVFNSVKQEAAFQGMDINNLTAEDSKNIMDILKDKVGQHVVAGEVGPTEINQAKTLELLKNKQISAFPEFSNIDAAFGPKANAYNVVEGRAPAILEGGGNRITKAAKLNSLKELSPELYDRAKGYRQVNSVVKAVKNPLVQGAAAGAASIPAIGGLLEAMIKHRQ